MASVVAKSSCSNDNYVSSLTVQEKSRNKRKFRADPPYGDSNNVTSTTQNKCPSYELSAEKFNGIQSGQLISCNVCTVDKDQSNELKLDLGLSTSVGSSNVSPSQFKGEVVIDEFQDANWSDLTEAELEELVLSCLDAIFKTAIKKIMTSGYSEEVATKAVSRPGICNGRKDTVSNIVDNALEFLGRGQDVDVLKEHFENLQQLEKCVLAELVGVLRDVRPLFSTGDAMWCLLICDTDLSHACTMDCDPLSGLVSHETSKSTSTITSQPTVEANSPEVISPGSSKQSQLTSCSSGSLPDAPTTDGICNRSELNNSVAVEGLASDEEGATSSSCASPSSLPFNLETCNTTSASPETNPQSPLPRASKVSLSSFAHTELSLSLLTNDNTASLPTICSVDCCEISYAQMLHDKSLWQSFPWSKKAEMFLKLAPRVRELQNQLQEWTEWANQKVMQAARRLNKDKAELKNLRQEKDELEKLKKDKKTLEENTMKKLSEMENALFKASGQVERANAAVRRLEVENAVLREEMEAAKVRASKAAADCQEASRREKNTLVKFQTWEKQKTLLQEELTTEKQKLMQLRLELEQAKDLQQQIQVRWRQEKKAKDELFAQARSIRSERERIESSGKSKENMIKMEADNNMRKCKHDIQELEKEISQLTLKNDLSKIAALRRGINESYINTISDSRNSSAQQSKSSDLPDISTCLQYYAITGGVKRERECVMCLSEEMSVVFLPCAHQVVCTKCNELHNKQGMKDCPSCRCTIQQRISVRYDRAHVVSQKESEF